MAGNSRNKGVFTISLDFELGWGRLDRANARQYLESHVSNVPEVIERLLEAFTRHGVHATFATVGFIAYPHPEALINDLPEVIPDYSNRAVSPYTGNFIADIPPEEYSLYFAPHLITLIGNTPGMEVATHTFSHYYCWEEGQTAAHFDADIFKACRKSRENGMELKSIVFPRNHVSGEHLEVCGNHGITIYRGNPSRFFSQKKGRVARQLQRACKLLDTYVNLSGRLSYPLHEVEEEGMWNVRASRFLRPYSKRLRIAEPMKIRRIKKEMTAAARRGEVYHLWWHPHNFGGNIEKNFRTLERLLVHYDRLREKYGMLSANMAEIAALARSQKG